MWIHPKASCAGRGGTEEVETTGAPKASGARTSERSKSTGSLEVARDASLRACMALLYSDCNSHIVHDAM